MQATCITGLVPLNNVQAMNNRVKLNVTDSQIEVSQQIVNLQSAGIGFEPFIDGIHQVTTSVNISASLCVPKGANANDTKAIQILTHGGGFGKGYWEFLPELSYVDYAAKHGAATFNYDRFGIGSSSTPGGDAPLQLVQFPVHVEILNRLIEKLKNGDFSGTKYPKVVATGHSFGSFVTVGLMNAYPHSIDAAILTGFTTSLAGVPFFTAALDLQIANRDSPRFAHLGDGYLIPGGRNAQQVAFFHYPGFTLEALQRAEDTKQPTTFGELMSIQNVINRTEAFTAPVFVANGEEDFPFCMGNCSIPTGQFPDLGAAVVPSLFPSVMTNGSMLYPNAGHGLNAQNIAPEAYNDIQKFIGAQGL
jgi:pimeloyl-ACP methyl ester carboxylesterase